MSNMLNHGFSQDYPATLSDYPFKGLWLWFWGALDPTSIEMVINQITKDLNHNEGWKCTGNTNFFPNCYREDEIERVLIAYAQLVEKGACNEYTDKNPNAYKVIKTVSDALSTDYARVQKILNLLLWGTNNGRYKGGQIILRPKTNSKKTGLEEIPQSIKDESLLQRLKEQAANTVDTAVTVGKWLLIGGFVVGGLYVINMVRPFLPKGK